MSETIVIVGFGPGTGTAVAKKFGENGFSLALVGRNEQKLAASVSELKAQGMNAFGFPADAGDTESIRAAIRAVRSQIGPITVIQWNAYSGLEAGDLLNVDLSSLRSIFDVSVFGLLAATEEALADLKGSGNGAILVANGAFGEASPEMDEISVRIPAMGLALSNAAKNKLAGLLAQRLKGEGVYVGEVMVHGAIKGTSSGNGGSIDPAIIADKYWELYKSRSETRASVK